MALRDQPYLPLYVQDFLTDEKLIECSPAATGVYIRLMCIMHKSEEYGKILLKQKDKQTGKQLADFAAKIHKQMPYDFADVLEGLTELVEESVVHIEGDYLVQHRMVQDNALSLVRSKAGKKGGIFAQAKVKANNQANAEYEYESNKEVSKEKKEKRIRESAKLDFSELIPPDWPANDFHAMMDEFHQMRKAKKKPLTDLAFKRAVSALVKLSMGDYQLAVKIAHKTIDKAWDVFYPYSEDGNYQKSKQDAGKQGFERDRA